MTASGVRHAPVTPQPGNLPIVRQPPRKLLLWVRLLPILFFFTYLNLTVFLFAYGPWPWPVGDGTKLYTFLVFAHSALLLGYLSAAFGRPGGYYGRWRPESLVKLSLLVTLVLLIPTSMARTGHLFPNIVGGLTNPGLVYSESIRLRSERTILTLVEYVRIIFGPLLFLLFPLTIYYWRVLNRTIKGLAILGILGFLGIYIASGTNKALADFIGVTPWLILAGHRAGFLRLNRMHKVRIVAGGTILLFLFLTFFTAGQVTRSGSVSLYRYFPQANIFADSNNFLIRDLAPSVQTGVIALTSYLTQGYYALYLSLEKPFIPMFGIGNSMFLYLNATELTGIAEIAQSPYPVRIEADGWDAYGLWATIYPWLASDVSFPGTILVVFLIGRCLAQSWLDALQGVNPFAIAVLSLFLIMLYYFPANNQLLQNGETLTGFYIILALWIFTRRKYVWGKKQMELSTVPVR